MTKILILHPSPLRAISLVGPLEAAGFHVEIWQEPGFRGGKVVPYPKYPEKIVTYTMAIDPDIAIISREWHGNTNLGWLIAEELRKAGFGGKVLAYGYFTRGEQHSPPYGDAAVHKASEDDALLEAVRRLLAKPTGES